MIFKISLCFVYVFQDIKNKYKPHRAAGQDEYPNRPDPVNNPEPPAAPIKASEDEIPSDYMEEDDMHEEDVDMDALAELGHP